MEPLVESLIDLAEALSPGAGRDMWNYWNDHLTSFKKQRLEHNKRRQEQREQHELFMKRMADRHATTNRQVEYAITVEPEIQAITDEPVPAEITLNFTPANTNVPAESTNEPIQIEAVITDQQVESEAITAKPESQVFTYVPASETEEVICEPADLISVPGETGYHR
jgi:hypothetical protein